MHKYKSLPHFLFFFVPISPIITFVIIKLRKNIKPTVSFASTTWNEVASVKVQGLPGKYMWDIFFISVYLRRIPFVSTVQCIRNTSKSEITTIYRQFRNETKGKEIINNVNSNNYFWPVAKPVHIHLSRMEKRTHTQCKPIFCPTPRCTIPRFTHSAIFSV